MPQLSSVANSIPEPSGHSFRPCHKSGRYHPGIAGRDVPESPADIIPESVAETFRNTHMGQAVRCPMRTDEEEFRKLHGV